jgi:hypothetical protein
MDNVQKVNNYNNIPWSQNLDLIRNFCCISRLKLQPLPIGWEPKKGVQNLLLMLTGSVVCTTDLTLPDALVVPEELHTEM